MIKPNRLKAINIRYNKYFIYVKGKFLTNIFINILSKNFP